ncbi:MAG: DUF928 domain-containing protein [Cyanobacteria bacterium P01_D01_bin.105]
MSKRHILSTLVALVAWSATYTPTATPSASILHNLKIGSSAQANVRWKPNPDRGSASSTLSGGRRGITASACALDSDLPDPALTLLVPAGNNTELTTQAQPTLAWFLESKAVTKMEFVLSHPTEAEPVYSKEINASAGLIEVTLPAALELEEGIRYRWTVFMTCNGGDNEVHARSFVKRIATDDLPINTSTMTQTEQASVYASHGIWYDTLNALIRAYREEAQLNTLLNIRDLLEQAGTEVPLDLSLATAAS